MIIPESGMTFGDYPTENVFWIEKSKFYTSVKTGVKICEFLLYDGVSLKLVEAKTTMPNPNNKIIRDGRDITDYETEMRRICEKIINTLMICYSIGSGRARDSISECPISVKHAMTANVRIKIYLVVRVSEQQWVNNITDDLRQRLYKECKILKLEVAAINEDMARLKKLVV